MLGLAASTVALLIALSPAWAQADGRGCAPGAPGLGDSYYPGYGNGGYNARQYELGISYDPGTERLDGRALIRAKATQDLCSFNLDLVGLEVQKVKVDGKGAAWVRSGQELTVTPRRPLEKQSRFKVAVRYGGVPIELLSGLTGFMPTSDGANVAGQPEAAATWFPVNDHPRDKASYSFDVTVPDGYEVVANGKPHGEDRAPGGRTTWHWEAREPMASYLVTIDVGYWDVTRWRTGSGVPVYDAVDPAITGELREEIYSSLARQGEVLDLLADAFGPYPFSTVGGIVDLERPLGFALENQTRPVYSGVFWLDRQGNPVNGDYVVVHELAHQWFGDAVALDRWQDIWLNEGFATYAEWMWLEHEGQATPQQVFQGAYAVYPADDPLWSVVIGDPGPELLFDEAVYVRGGLTLQALRTEVGDDAFWEIIRKWASTKSGESATTEAFIALAERVSGRQLDELFETWLFTPQRPILPAASRGDLAPQATTERSDDGAEAWLENAQARVRHGRY